MKVQYKMTITCCFTWVFLHVLQQVTKVTEEYTLVLLTDTSKRAQEPATILHRGRGIVGGPPLPSGGRGNVIINILWLHTL